MPVAYSYIRMSRPEQLRGDSLRRQTEAAEGWAAARGVTIDDTIRDIGISAYRGANRTVGALAAFLKMVEEGRIERGSFLIVESLDRLSRETVLDTLPRFIDLIKAGVVIVTLMDKQEYSKERLTADWTPLIVSLAVMARAHDESRTKGIRVREAWDKKRTAAAEKVLTSRVPAWLRVVDGKIETIPKRVEVVQRIFRETVAGDGRRTIVRRLNADKVPPFAGGRGWQDSYVAKLLSNRAVMGEFQAYRREEGGPRLPYGDPVPGYFPVVVSSEDFHAASNARRSRTAAPGRRGTDVTNLFLGLAKCAGCGGSMILQNKGAPPKGGRYFVCSSAGRSAGCDHGRRWRLDRTEAAVLRALAYSDLTAFDTRPDRGSNDPVAPIEAELADMKARRERLLGLVEEGDASATDRYRSLAARISNLKRRLQEADLLSREETTVPTFQEQSRLLGAMLAEMNAAKDEARRDVRTRISQALRIALRRVSFGRHEVVAHFQGPRVAYRFPRPVARLGEPLPDLQVRVLYDGPPLHDPEPDDPDQPPPPPLPEAWRARAAARKKSAVEI